MELEEEKILEIYIEKKKDELYNYYKEKNEIYGSYNEFFQIINERLSELDIFSNIIKDRVKNCSINDIDQVLKQIHDDMHYQVVLTKSFLTKFKDDYDYLLKIITTLHNELQIYSNFIQKNNIKNTNGSIQ